MKKLIIANLMKLITGEDLFSKLESKKHLCVLNLSKRDFDHMCFELNEVLNESCF